jgi:hypothetical protein
MISQNRADAKREVIANAQWTTVQEEEPNQRLELSAQILELTKPRRIAAYEPGSVRLGAGLPQVQILSPRYDESPGNQGFRRSRSNTGPILLAGAYGSP